MIKKKIMCCCLAIVLLLSLFSVSGFSAKKSALSISYGISALRGQFQSGIGPVNNGYQLDYMYYSPVGRSDSTKYPIVIYLSGIGHGQYPGNQLQDSDLAYWSSAEYQSRFAESGGAFILMPRSPENKSIYWNRALIEPLRALIDDFIDIHAANVDTTRIYIGGSSAGGSMTWDMLVAFPQYFAAAFPIAATEQPTAADVKTCADTAVWMFASTLDPFVNYQLNTLVTFNLLKSYNNNPALCRLSSFSSVKRPDGTNTSDNHHLAAVITCDMFTYSGEQYPNCTTQNGLGETVTLQYPNGMIAWMSAIHSQYGGEDGIASGNMNVNIFTDILGMIKNIFLKVVNAFQILFGLTK